VAFELHGFVSPPFWLARAGVFFAWLFFLKKPSLANSPRRLQPGSARSYRRSTTSTGSTEVGLARLTRWIGYGLWKGGDEVLIDGGWSTARRTRRWFGSVIRRVQNGYLIRTRSGW